MLAARPRAAANEVLRRGWIRSAAAATMCSLLLSLGGVLAAPAAAASPQQHAPPTGTYFSYALPEVTVVAATHYDAGLQLGSAVKGRLNEYLALKLEQQSTQDHLHFIREDPFGKQMFATLLQQTASAFPQYMEEVQGTADGAAVDATLLHFLNMEVEVSAASKSHYVDDCTTLMANTRDNKAMAHNEDNDELSRGYAYIVHMTITTNDDEEEGEGEGEGEEASTSTEGRRGGGGGNPKGEGFTAYCYPGCLPGRAWGFTHTGLSLASNAVFPLPYEETGVSRSYIARHFLTASSVRGVIGIARAHAVAFGYSANLAGWSVFEDETQHQYQQHQHQKEVEGERDSMSLPPPATTTTTTAPRYLESPQVSMANVEAANSLVQVTPVQEDGAPLDHVNMLKHLLTVPQRTDESSVHRQKRLDELQLQQLVVQQGLFSSSSSSSFGSSVEAMLDALGDTQDEAYPLFRTATPPDGSATLCTVTFDYIAGEVTMYTFTGNPSLTEERERWAQRWPLPQPQAVLERHHIEQQLVIQQREMERQRGEESQ